jgi:hypothetical protein
LPGVFSIYHLYYTRYQWSKVPALYRLVRKEQVIENFRISPRWRCQFWSLKEHTTSIFSCEDGGNMFLWIIDICLQVHMASQSGRPVLTSNWKVDNVWYEGYSVVVCTGRVGSDGNTLYLYLGGAQLKSQLGHWLSSLRLLVGFLCISSQIPRYYLEMVLNHFLLSALNLLKIIILLISFDVK